MPRADLLIPASEKTAWEHARWISTEVMRETKIGWKADLACQNAFKMGMSLDRFLKKRRNTPV